MQAKEFTTNAPGQLIPVDKGVAFLPNDLPPALPPSWELANLLDEATSSLATFVGQAVAVSNHRLLVRALLARDAVESNRIEGTQTHIQDVLTQEAVGPPKNAERAQRNFEVLRSMDAATRGEGWLADDRPITVYLLRTLHAELMQGTRGQNKHPGSFRTIPVVIGKVGDGIAEAVFVPAPPEHIPGRMDQLVDFIQNDRAYPPLVSAALAHYQFETVHPFEDGNGRLGRILITLMLVARKLIQWPVLFLSPYLNANREQYFTLLKRVSTHGEWIPWVRFFLEGVIAQSNDGLRRARLMAEMHAQYRDAIKAQTRSQAALLAVDYVMERAVVTVPGLAAYASCDYRTARSALKALETVGAVEPHKESYPQAWIAVDLIDRVYGDD